MKTTTPDLRRRKLLAAMVTTVGGLGMAAAASVPLLTSMLSSERTRIDKTPIEPAGSTTQMKPHPAVDRLAEDALSGPLVLTGVASAAGLGLGEAVVVSPAVELESVPDKTIVDREAEALRFKQVVAAELEEIKRLSQRLQSLLPPDHGALFDAYILLLSSDSLMNSTLIRIHQGNWAPGALRTTILDYAQRFENLDDPYLQERAADIRDLGQRLLKRLLQPTPEAEGRTYPAHTILMAEEIGVSQLLEVPPEQLAGLVSVHGTGASHVALLARGLDIPAVFGVTHLPLSDLNRREVVVDGYSARVCIQPSPTLRQEYLKLAEEKAELVRGLQELRHLPALTPDGHHLELHANSGLFADIAVARESGAEGVGLHRSELNFYLFDHFPSEEEQTVIYTQVLKAMAPRPVVLRTLDVGGDKPLPYFPIKEQNPVLGWRGIRVSLAQPALFKTQLRAMLRAGTTCPNLAILFPMITCVNELSEVLELLRQAHAELVADGLPAVSPRVGLLVEVPSTVYQIDTLACRVDFVSIGSNDLTQYLLAVDRNNDRVATLYDSLHPAVLQAIQQVVERAHLAGRPVSVCGEMAGDPAAALLLLAMGVDKLSLSLGNLLKIKWMVRTISHRHAQALLTEVMQMDSAGPIRERLHQVLEEYGLGSLTKD